MTMTVERTNDAHGAPAFIISLKEDAVMECGRIYEVVVVPVSGELDLDAIRPDSIKSTIKAFTGSSLDSMRVSSQECIIRWKASASCPHVPETRAWDVANAIKNAISTPDAPARAHVVGMVWIQSNWLYLAGGVALAGIGALGASLLHRRLKR